MQSCGPNGDGVTNSDISPRQWRARRRRRSAPSPAAVLTGDAEPNAEFWATGLLNGHDNLHIRDPAGRQRFREQVEAVAADWK
jgi:hypothetical protein